ncbi:hypothetical protein ACG02S_09405 [Roseateles sp. DC23W]|uniref:Pentapeptide MXKDX repeat protein n=1 Tax=Pelomonas dachongensis TaxID=3299029 RepID=A0ABW7EKY2_9BURK
MKTLLIAATLAIALAAPAAQARTAPHHDGSQLSSAVQAKAGKKKVARANKHKKHKKHAKKGHKKSA